MKCLAFDCQSVWYRGKRKFHDLPKNKELAKKWLILINRMDLLRRLNDEQLDIGDDGVCTKHFSPWDYEDEYQKCLKEDALPKIISTNNQKPLDSDAAQSSSDCCSVDDQDCEAEEQNETTSSSEDLLHGKANRKRVMRIVPPSVKQRDFLIDYIEKNMHLASYRTNTDMENNKKAIAWKELAEQLNAMEGAKKNSAQWRKYWIDIISKSKAKLRSKKCKLFADNTLTEQEVKILNILNENLAEAKKGKDLDYVSLENENLETPSSELEMEHNAFSAHNYIDLTEEPDQFSVVQNNNPDKSVIQKKSKKSAEPVGVSTSLESLENENMQTASSDMEMEHNEFPMEEEPNHVTVVQSDDYDNNVDENEIIESADHVLTSKSLEYLEDENMQSASSEMEMEYNGLSTHNFIDLTEESEHTVVVKNDDTDEIVIEKESIQVAEHERMLTSLGPLENKVMRTPSSERKVELNEFSMNEESNSVVLLQIDDYDKNVIQNGDIESSVHVTDSTSLESLKNENIQIPSLELKIEHIEAESKSVIVVQNGDRETNVEKENVESTEHVTKSTSLKCLENENMQTSSSESGMERKVFSSNNFLHLTEKSGQIGNTDERAIQMEIIEKTEPIMVSTALESLENENELSSSSGQREHNGISEHTFIDLTEESEHSDKNGFTNESIVSTDRVTASTSLKSLKNKNMQTLPSDAEMENIEFCMKKETMHIATFQNGDYDPNAGEKESIESPKLTAVSTLLDILKNKNINAVSSKLKIGNNEFSMNKFINLKEESKHISVGQTLDYDKNTVAKGSIESGENVSESTSLQYSKNKNIQTPPAELKMEYIRLSLHDFTNFKADLKKIAVVQNDDNGKIAIQKESIEAGDHAMEPTLFELPAVRFKEQKSRKVLRSSGKFFHSIMAMERETLQLKREQMELKQKEIEIKKRKLKILERMLEIETKNGDLLEKMLLELSE